jgi:hypothetical protein
MYYSPYDSTLYNSLPQIKLLLIRGGSMFHWAGAGWLLQKKLEEELQKKLQKSLDKTLQEAINNPEKLSKEAIKKFNEIQSTEENKLKKKIISLISSPSPALRPASCPICRNRRICIFCRGTGLDGTLECSFCSGTGVCRCSKYLVESPNEYKIKTKFSTKLKELQQKIDKI